MIKAPLSVATLAPSTKNTGVRHKDRMSGREPHSQIREMPLEDRSCICPLSCIPLIATVYSWGTSSMGIRGRSAPTPHPPDPFAHDGC